MARTITELTIFIAWPSDVKRERDKALRVVEEINRTLGGRFGVTVVAKDWKSVVRPAAGRPQAVINQQIGPYDIFVGILWMRLGSQAGKGKTGFEEEFDMALKAWRNKRQAGPSILMYFREGTPRTVSSIDTKQLAAVNAFKAKIFKRRTLFAYQYHGPTEFERMLRQHLIQEVLERLEKATKVTRSTKPASKQPKPRKSTTPKRRKTTTKKPPRSPLPVPKVPKRITAADHAAFARKGFNSVRYRFERAAKAFNREHTHAQINVRRDGSDAFTCEALVEGVSQSLARITLRQEGWNQQWAIVYERGALLGFGSSTPHYSPDLTVAVYAEDNQLHYRLPHLSWNHPGREETEPADIASHFWNRFTEPLTRR